MLSYVSASLRVKVLHSKNIALFRVKRLGLGHLIPPMRSIGCQRKRTPLWNEDPPRDSTSEWLSSLLCNGRNAGHICSIDSSNEQGKNLLANWIASRDLSLGNDQRPPIDDMKLNMALQCRLYFFIEGKVICSDTHRANNRNLAELHWCFYLANTETCSTKRNFISAAGSEEQEELVPIRDLEPPPPPRPRGWTI